MPDLLNRVKVRPARVYVGEPLEVKAEARKDACGGATEITVDGIPGEEQCLQFAEPGRRKIAVVAGGPQSERELRTVDVEVVPREDECDTKGLFPIIGIDQNFSLASGATLRVENADEFGDDVYYAWVIDGEVRLTSAEPCIEHSFAQHIDPDSAYTVCRIAVHVKSGDNKAVYSGRRSVTVWNDYRLGRQQGLIQVEIEPEIYARRDGDRYVGRFVATNRERDRVNFNSCVVEYLYNDPEKLSVPGRQMEYQWQIGPEERQEGEFSLPAKEVPRDAFGFAVHLRGVTGRKERAFADIYFELRVNPRAMLKVTSPAVSNVLSDLRDGGVLANRDVISLPALERHLERGDRGDALRPRWPGTGRTAVESFRRDLLAHTPPAEIHASEEGDRCTPEDEEHPADDLVCQLVDEWEWVMIPARILNARKGDVILSPGGNGPIGGLLQRVTPSQVYSHSGIMISNHYRVRHSTASQAWLEDAAAGTTIEGSPGTEGIDPEKLKYAWPGTIDQSADAAFNGSAHDDPDGLLDEDGSVRSYKISAFGNSTELVGGVRLVEPLVVKPDALAEAENPAIRQMLHAVAESAKEIDGHYRFYCYTDANAFFDDFFRAPSRSGWWAAGTRPTVCSSLIWAAIKRIQPEMMLEGSGPFTQPSDLEQGAAAGWGDAGAEVDFHTRDGLYYYREDERRAAGEWLYDYFYNLAYEKMVAKAGDVFGWVVNLFSDAADDLGNQMCNTFAFDWTGEDDTGEHAKDSDRWSSPSDGHAVSPDNIRDYWDAPQPGRVVHGLYGYSERLIYRPARLEYRRVSRWVRSTEEATLRGRVTYRGEAVAGAVVKLAGREALTDRGGEFTLTVPAGEYRVEAGKLIDGWFVSTSTDVGLDAGEERSIALVLEEPDALQREITVRGSMYIVDDELFSDETVTRDVFMAGVRVGPSTPVAERFQSEGMGGEVRIELKLRFEWHSNASVDVLYEVKLFEGTSEDTSDLDAQESGVVNVPADGTIPLTVDLFSTEWGSDDRVVIGLQVTNARQP